MREKIKQWIDENEGAMIEDLGKLIRHESVSVAGDDPARPYGPGCEAVLNEFLTLGKGYGFAADSYANRLGSLAWDNGGKSIGLWGHLDVVPATGDWINPPFACTRKGDTVFGRGVSDNKGPTVLSLYAMRCIRDLSLPFRNSIVLMGGLAEETGMDDVEYYVANHKAPDYNIVADAEFPVCYAEKGILDIELASQQLSDAVIAFQAGTVTNIVPDRATLTLTATPDIEAKLASLPEGVSAKQDGAAIIFTATGMAKHSASPEGSVNAIGKLIAALSDAKILTEKDAEALVFIRAICTVHDGEPLGINCADDVSGALTCVGSVIRFEEGKAVLSVNIRYPVTADSEKLCASIREKSSQAGYDVLEIIDNKANYVEKDSFFVQALTNAYNMVTGEDAQPYTMGGGTYARKIPNAVAFGAGLAYDHTVLGLPEGHGLYHCPDESYSVSLMKKGLEIYIMSLLELDKQL